MLEGVFEWGELKKASAIPAIVEPTKNDTLCIFGVGLFIEPAFDSVKCARTFLRV